MPRVNLKGLHRVKTKLARGRIKEQHYAWRGGPRIWSTDSDFKIGSPEYIQAFSDAAPRGEKSAGKFRGLILQYLSSGDFKKLSDRYKKDIRNSINNTNNGIDMEFGDAPLAVFGDSRIRGRVLKWRDGIGGKVGDDRVRHLQKIISFGYDRSDLREHHLRGIKAIYKSNRAEILWTLDEIEKFTLAAPDYVSRILIAATETGLRPGDLWHLSMFHIKKTPQGRRIEITTAKKGRRAVIPVTERMGKLIDATPQEQDRILVNSRNGIFATENGLGDVVAKWRDKLNIRKVLRLYDARGTAATRLLLAGAEIREIATAMGWSVKRANEVIDVARHRFLQ